MNDQSREYGREVDPQCDTCWTDYTPVEETENRQSCQQKQRLYGHQAKLVMSGQAGGCLGLPNLFQMDGFGEG
jgi:hypothetical protein